MVEQLLQIKTTPMQYEFKVSNATLEYNADKANIKISRDKGGLSMKSEFAKVNIDTFDARNSMFPTTRTSIAQLAQKGLTSASQATARYAGEGEILMNTKPGEGRAAITQINTQRYDSMYQKEFGLGFKPQGGANITVDPYELTTKYQMDKLSFDTKIQAGKFQFTPADFSVSITEHANIEISYIGSPIYVPPSSEEFFKGNIIDATA